MFNHGRHGQHDHDGRMAGRAERECDIPMSVSTDKQEIRQSPCLEESGWDLQGIVSSLRDARRDWRSRSGRLREAGGAREFPSVEEIRGIVNMLCGALFPMRLGPLDLHEDNEDAYVQLTLANAMRQLERQVFLELSYLARQRNAPCEELAHRAHHVAREFAASLPNVRRMIDTDVIAAFQGDPAARSVDEVLLSYPGVKAIIHHRLAHVLYVLDAPLVARIIAEIAHADTGIDIHPGARIGGSFFIDHGTGVVIGETTIIGERVRLYQTVTLGAKRFPATPDGALKKGLPRHPILEDDVVVYAGATVLGRITVGRASIIGGNVWLTHSVPPGSNITQASAINAEAENARKE
ncbi:serine O-acetyltransferase [Kerstersia gyiorum]|uniref:Serine O-acetyltransferase n=2 Tax=Kerstersia gyiorum TaxID=206506 RepID=A0A4Q7MQE4_9BURK|nr:serine O-acetyltransferase [Kerstersia gyiorum]